MKKKNETHIVEAELIPSPDMILRSGVDMATFNKLVQQKVAEIMAERDAVVFEPFFRNRQLAYELKRMQSVPEQRKWTIYFERYGCLICETKKQIHAGNGMCNRCHNRTFAALRQIIAEGMKGETARPARGAPLAERLLPANASRDGVHRSWYERRKMKGED